MKINVVKHKGYCGFELVEVIERKAIQIRETRKRGTRGMFNGHYKVSYKGKTYKTFYLHKAYEDCMGTCIAINDPTPLPKKER